MGRERGDKPDGIGSSSREGLIGLAGEGERIYIPEWDDSGITP